MAHGGGGGTEEIRFLTDAHFRYRKQKKEGGKRGKEITKERTQDPAGMGDPAGINPPRRDAGPQGN